MGRDLAERFPAAREVFDEINEALGMHLTRIMWDGNDRALTLTHNAQPAILATTLAIHRVVGELLNPVCGAGHSLGEYSAYAIAGSLSTCEAARLVRRRGELMLEASEHRGGAMAAVVGLDTATVERLCADASTENETVVAANINSPDQTVISGDPAAVGRASEACKAANAKRVISLKVSGAFHSPLMAPAKDALEKELNDITFRDPSFPIVANASAKPVSTGSEARRLLGEQLISPVRWVESMTAVDDLADESVLCLEIGPGTVLAGLMRKIVKQRRTVSLGGAEEVAAFLEQKKG